MKRRKVFHATLTAGTAISLLCASVIFACAADLIIPADSTFNVNSGTISVPGNITNAGTLSVTTGSITLTGSWANTGIFTKGTGTVTFNGTAQSDITGTNSFYNLTLDTNTDGAKTVRFGAGQTQTITNTFTVTGYVGKVLTIRSTTDGTQGILDIPASITSGVDYVDVKDNYVDGENHTITAGDNSTDSGNNVNWIFGTGTPITIEGSIYQSDRTTKLTTQTVRLSVNGRSPVQTTASGGDFTFSNIKVNTGDAIVLWLDGDAVYKGNTITVVQELDITDMALYAGHVTLRYETGSSITNNNLYTAKGALTDTDIKYSVTGAGNNNLSVDDGYEFYIPALYTHAPAGTLTVNDIEIGGSLDAAGNDVTVSGDWDNSAGAYTSGANTTAFNGTSKQTLTSGGVTAAKSFNNLTHSGTGELELAASNALNVNDTLLQSGAGDFDTNANDITCAALSVSAGTFNNDARAGTWDVNGGVSISTGTLTATSGELKVSGDWAFTSGSFEANSGTVTFDGAAGSISTLSGDTTFYNLKCVTAGKELDFTAGSDQGVNNTLTLTGSSASKVKLRSTSSPSKWDITFPNAAQNVSYVDVKDSDANTHTVTCYNSTDSGNNNANWIFNPLTITSPVDARTVGTTPTVRGTAGAGDTVEIKDISGNTVATTTADANQNYRVAVTTALAEGANSLTPYVGIISGAAVSIEVIPAPSASQVPVITSPASGARIKGAAPTITGSAKASETVTLTAKDSNGNLLLTDAASAAVTASGSYTIQSTDYTTDLPKGTNYLSVTVDGVTSAIIDVSLYDPFGVVFDSVTDNLVGGAVVTIFKSDGTRCTPGVEIDAADTNPQTVGADGAYSFLAVNGDYYTTVEVVGYTYPSSKTSFPAGRTIVTGSKGEVFTVGGAVIEMDQPLDPIPLLLKVEKEANKKEVVVGDVVTYTVTIKNESSGDVTDVYLEDKIPAGFKYISGKTILDNARISDPTGNRPLTFSIGTVSTSAVRTLKYQLVVGSGVTFGKYENLAFAKYSNGTIISNNATERVKVVPDPLFDLATVIGKVFWDWDEDGAQGPEAGSGKLEAGSGRPEAGSGKLEAGSGKPEAGVANVRLAMEDGTIVVTDKDGKYHLPEIIPGRHVIRLDERTLPEGAYLTTDKAVIIDITPGILSKVNFGVNSNIKNQISKTQTENQNIKIIQEREKPRASLNAGCYEEAESQYEFRIFTNYSLFINKWKLEILDKDTKGIIKRFEGAGLTINDPICWDGYSEDRKQIKTGRNYVYILTVFGNGGRQDVTKERELIVGVRKPETGNQKTKDEIARERLEWIQRESKVNNLDKQNIRIDGEIINIKYQKSNIKNIRILKSGNLEREIPIVQRGGLTAKELLEKPRFEKEREFEQGVDIIIPKGEYDIQVMPQEAEAGPETSGVRRQNIESLPPITDNQEPKTEIYTRHIKVGGDYLFFVAMGDVKAGYTFNRGDIEPVQQDDKFKEGFWGEGKLAYYLKGKILGKYLITSSLDTERRTKELFKNLDQDKYYPVYGDDSSINYAAASTQGPLYLLIEWDKSSLLWGNYATGFTDTEFAQFSRTLYGGKIHYESVSATRFGEPHTRLIVFRARAQQRAAHNEFLGTGGALFYLKHKDIVEGSEKVKIEIRDKITGLVLTSKEMKEGVDYEMNYPNSRIIFWKPVSHIVESDSIISSNLLDGNIVYVVADYEYEVKEKYDEGTYGARLQQSIGDYIRVGGTYVKEGQLDKSYELKGADSVFRLSKDITLIGEYAESESEALGSFISTDGGLSFTEMPVSDLGKGKAYGLRADAHLLGRLGLTGYYKQIEKGFSSAAATSQQGKELMGIGAALDITSRTRLRVTHDIQKLIDDGNPQTRLQVGAQKTETTSAQIAHEMERLTLTGEYRHQEVTGKKEQFESETNTAEDTVAARADYKPTDKVTFSLEQQATLSGSPNHQTTAEIQAKLNEKISLKAKEIIGTQGAATSVGAAANIEDKIQITGDYARQNYKSGETADTVSLGGAAKIDEKTEVHTALTLTGTSLGDRTQSIVFGSEKKLNEELTLTANKTYAKSGDNLTLSDSFGLTREKDGRRMEGTFTEQKSRGAAAASNTNIFGLSGDINDKWAAQGSFERGVVQNYSGDRSTRNAGSVGLGFVNKDEKTQEVTLKASSRLELRLDEGQQDKRQYLAYNAVEGKINPDTTIFAKANFSQTKNITLDSTEAQYKELVSGIAYRPINFDRLNLLAKYTYLEDDSPSGQSGFKDIEKEKSHTLAGEVVYDLTDKWQLSEKLAYKFGEEKVSGFDFTKTETWLIIHRLNYHIDKDWQASAEYRLLGQKQARDYKQGALVELSRKIGEFIQLGAGYNFTDFNDDLTRLDYTAQGPFIRLTGKLYDRTPEEIERLRQKLLEENIKLWTWELINEELAKPDSQIMRELYRYFYLAQAAQRKGNPKESRNYYEKILQIGKMMYNEAEEYIRGRIELEKEIKEYNALALAYHKEGRLQEAKGLWEKMLKYAEPKLIYLEITK